MTLAIVCSLSISPGGLEYTSIFFFNNTVFKIHHIYLQRYYMYIVAKAYTYKNHIKTDITVFLLVSPLYLSEV